MLEHGGQVYSLLGLIGEVCSLLEHGGRGGQVCSVLGDVGFLMKERGYVGSFWNKGEGFRLC